MNYVPHTEQEIEQMLQEIGITSIDDLFAHIPDEVQLNEPMNLQKGISELEVSQKLQTMANKNLSFASNPIFMGGGVYDHYIPPAVDALANRSEFYTAYTPYQPEASQGTLQGVIEYQTAISKLTGMDIANASMYDGSSALAEAILMSVGITRKKEVILSETIHPEWIEVVKTYLSYREINVKIVEHHNGETNFEQLISMISSETGCICLQSPNFFGVIENYSSLKQKIEKKVEKSTTPLLVVATYPFSLGLLKSPGEMNADIVVGDGQSLGNYIGFGGPHFGFLACKKNNVRKIPGRIVGETVDKKNKKGYCLTFQTREQHIRREKATSNICSNQALMALRAIIYLSLVGEEGFKEAASLAYHKAHYLQKKICELSSFKLKFNKPFYNEFAIESQIPIKAVNAALLNESIIGGLDLNQFSGTNQNDILFAVTEKRSQVEMDHLITTLKKFG